MNALLIFAVIGSLLFAWVCVFHIIPSCLMSMFRYRLWRQRDELAAEIRNEVFEDAGPAECLVELLERFIRFAPEFSPFRLILARVSVAGMDLPPQEIKDLDFSHPPDRQQDLIKTHIERLNETVANHVLFETPSGWMTVLALLPVALVKAATMSHSDDDDKDRHRPLDDVRQRVSEDSLDVARHGPFAARSPRPHLVG